MRDLHSHYLPGVDDGSKNMETTKRMLANAKEAGITDIMFTPHYIINSRYSSSKEDNEKIFAPIIKMAKEEYNINVFLGNEVFCNKDILKHYQEGKIATLNNSKYMLIELPLSSKMLNVKEIFFELLNAGIIPILAHPERYVSYYNDLDFFMELRHMGVLMQINYPSLMGEYGFKAKRMAKKLLKSGIVSFVGSDVHSDNENKYKIIPSVEKKLKKLLTENEFIDITMNNFARVVRNDDIV